MNTSSFVHLRCHTEYSIRDGMIRIQDLINQVKMNDMSAIAITDYSNLFALVKFYQRAISAGIKPIIGTDLWIYENDKKYQVSCYCQNEQGYRNLICLISRAYKEGQLNNIPTIRWHWLKEWNEGLIVLSGGRQGDVGISLLSGNQSLAERRIQRWLDIFGDRYYLELTRTGRDSESRHVEVAIDLAEKFNVPVVATNEVCFLLREDFEAHEARVCINSGYALNDATRPKNYSELQYLRSSKEMQSLFSDIPEAIENTIEIAKRCTLKLTLGKPVLPNFAVPEDITLEQYLKEKTLKGLKSYFLKCVTIREEDHQVYQLRVQSELNVINTMGFAGYFLIVSDFIGWAKSQDIPVGPGRGSGAGSLVAFCLHITALDPIKHDLLFERFLNPERVSMPDFDIDFCMERRDEVIDYVAERYGRESVSQIITYGTMTAKAVLRDVGRVFGMPYGYVSKIAKLIPFELGMTLSKAIRQEKQLSELYQDQNEVKVLIDLAMKLEGLTRNAGKHAGGVVISPTKLTDFTPLYCESDGKNVVTQFDKDDVEAVGLVKFDFLGLRTLTIIHWALKSINLKRAKEDKKAIDIKQIPLDDEKTYALLRTCATTAIFQLESRGMKELIHRLQPDTFEDMIALVALFRPGPLQSGMVDDFIDRKHGRSEIHYSHPELEPILRNTNGVILYQEQVMEIARRLAGYSLGAADILRRAMGKKKLEEMAQQRVIFIKGAEKNGISKDISEHIFNIMEKFASYGFNKSHSAAYALISYQTAWLKAHYPGDFMVAVLSSDMDNTDKVVLFLNECSRMDLKVKVPNINVSFYAFQVNTENEIEYGLGAIKGVGESAVMNIIQEREANGSFQDLFDFCHRVDLRKVNKRTIESLIMSGAMDDFGKNRGWLIASLSKTIQKVDQQLRDEEMGQNDLFAKAKNQHTLMEYKNFVPWDEAKRLKAEKETLGCYLSGHPFQLYEEELKKIITSKIGELSQKLGKNTVIAGILMSIRVLNRKNGRLLVILGLEDRSGKTEAILFSKLYNEIVDSLEKDQVVILKGKIEEDSYTGGVRMMAESCETIDQIRSRLAKKLVISIGDSQKANQLLLDLPRLIERFLGGSCPVIVVYKNVIASVELQLGNAWKVNPKNTLLLQLKEFFGEKKVSLEY